MPPDDPAKLAQARYRAWLAARVEPQPYPTPRPPHGYVGHDAAESRYLQVFPEDGPFRHHLREVGADHGLALRMADGWADG